MYKSFILLILLSLCACQSRASASGAATEPVVTAPASPLIAPTLTPAPSATPTLRATVPPPNPTEQFDWANSPHALPFVGASVAAPTDPANQIAAAAPCTACHQQDAGASIGSNLAWWDPTAGQYRPAADVNELCQKCHPQTGIAKQASAGDASIHAGFQCTACHDPHTTVASCSNATCHQNVRQTNDLPPSTPTGGHPHVGAPFCGGGSCHPAATAAAMQPRSVHGGAHVNVTCQACHAAGDLKAGPGKDGGPWVIWQAADQAGAPAEVPYFPHITQVKVDCQRCHFGENPWDLPLVTGSEFQK